MTGGGESARRTPVTWQHLHAKKKDRGHDKEHGHRLEAAAGGPLWATLPQQGVGKRSAGGPFPPLPPP